jgi:hypothetical protein
MKKKMTVKPPDEKNYPNIKVRTGLFLPGDGFGSEEFHILDQLTDALFQPGGFDNVIRRPFRKHFFGGMAVIHGGEKEDRGPGRDLSCHPKQVSAIVGAKVVLRHQEIGLLFPEPVKALLYGSEKPNVVEPPGTKLIFDHVAVDRILIDDENDWFSHTFFK